MELQLNTQAEGIALALAAGLALALLYDAVSPLRRSFSRLTWLFDAIYALCAGIALFSLAMSRPFGRLGLWEPAAAALAFWLYMNLISPLLSPIFSKVFQTLTLPVKKILKYLRKV